MYWTLLLFPLHGGLEHLAYSYFSNFYPAFTNAEKCEWIAWTNTVFFQTTFTLAGYLWLDNDAVLLARYFLMYTVYDTIWLTTYSRDKLMYLHHMIAGLYSLSSFWAPAEMIYGISVAARYLEASNILLGTAWLLNRAGYGKSMLVKVVGGLALLVYMFLRNVMFPYQLFHSSPDVALLLSIFVPLNIFWTWKLAKFYYRIAFLAPVERR